MSGKSPTSYTFDKYSNETFQIRGLDCLAHHWNVESSSPRALVIVFHGFLTHGTYPTVRYAAELLSSANYACVAVDLPGHGQSEGLAGYLESASTVLEDGATIVKYATKLMEEKNTKKYKIFLVGSSMGGSIALAVAQKLKEQISGVVLLGPMLKLNVSPIERFGLQGLAMICPTVSLIPSSSTNSEKQYRDEAKRKECDTDPYTVSGAYLKPGSALALVEMTDLVQDQFESTTVPFLLMIADQDVVIKNEGSEQLFEKSPSQDKTKKNYPALHGLLCEPSPLCETIQNDMLSWLNARSK